MSDPKPVYKLPEIMPAPASEVGRLARRLIEYADLSAVRPLLDELEAAGRLEDVQHVRVCLGIALCEAFVEPKSAGPGTRGSRWEEFARNVLEFLWFDVFDVTESLAALEKHVRPKTGEAFVLPVGATVEVMEVAGTVHVGGYVYATWDGRVTEISDGVSPPVGIALNDSYVHEGREIVEVQLTPEPASASAVANAGAAEYHGGTPSGASAGPSSPPEPPAAD